jgi:hypothetical protein
VNSISVFANIFDNLKIMAPPQIQPLGRRCGKRLSIESLTGASEAIDLHGDPRHPRSIQYSTNLMNTKFKVKLFKLLK